MKEYDCPIVILNHGPPFPAHLKVICLPLGWYAVIWQHAKRYQAFSVDRTNREDGFEDMSDADFLLRVQIHAELDIGIEFTFASESTAPKVLH